MLGAHRHQPVVAQGVDAHHLGALPAPPGGCAARRADGPCAGTSRRRGRAAARRARRSSGRASASRRPGAAVSRRRVSMFSLPRPRTSLASRCSSSTCSAASPARRCSARRARPRSGSGRARRSRARRSTRPSSTRRPGGSSARSAARRVLSASYEKRSRSASQHSLTSSFSSGRTRIDLRALDLDDQVGAGRVVRAHALPARELPGARAVAERLRGDRADRAEVDHVARELGVDRVAGDGRDLGVLAAMDHAELHHAADLDCRSGRSACSGCSGSSPASRAAGRRPSGRRRACPRRSATTTRRSRPRGPAAGTRRPGRRSGSRAGG